MVYITLRPQKLTSANFALYIIVIQYNMSDVVNLAQATVKPIYIIVSLSTSKNDLDIFL